MDAYEKVCKLGEEEFKLITGVTRGVFDEMNAVLRRKHAEEHARGGIAGMSTELRLTLALEYWREYRTYRHMANDHQISKSKINNAVMWVENTLAGSDEYKLKELKERFKAGEESEIKVVLIDVEEQPIERPTENQEEAYSGKKNGTRRNTRW